MLTPEVLRPRVRTPIIAAVVGALSVAIAVFVAIDARAALQRSAYVGITTVHSTGAVTCPLQSWPYWVSDGESCRFVGLAANRYSLTITANTNVATDGTGAIYAIDPGNYGNWCESGGFTPAVNCFNGAMSYDGCHWACRRVGKFLSADDRWDDPISITGTANTTLGAATTDAFVVKSQLLDSQRVT